MEAQTAAVTLPAPSNDPGIAAVNNYETYAGGEYLDGEPNDATYVDNNAEFRSDAEGSPSDDGSDSEGATSGREGGAEAAVAPAPLADDGAGGATGGGPDSSGTSGTATAAIAAGAVVAGAAAGAGAEHATDAVAHTARLTLRKGGRGPGPPLREALPPPDPAEESLFSALRRVRDAIVDAGRLDAKHPLVTAPIPVIMSFARWSATEGAEVLVAAGVSRTRSNAWRRWVSAQVAELDGAVIVDHDDWVHFDSPYGLPYDVQTARVNTVRAVVLNTHDSEGKLLPLQRVLPTFLHELAHCITPGERQQLVRAERGGPRRGHGSKYKRIHHGTRFYAAYGDVAREAERLEYFAYPSGARAPKFSQKMLLWYDRLDLSSAGPSAGFAAGRLGTAGMRLLVATAPRAAAPDVASGAGAGAGAGSSDGAGPAAAGAVVTGSVGSSGGGGADSSYPYAPPEAAPVYPWKGMPDAQIPGSDDTMRISVVHNGKTKLVSIAPSQWPQAVKDGCVSDGVSFLTTRAAVAAHKVICEKCCKKWRLAKDKSVTLQGHGVMLVTVEMIRDAGLPHGAVVEV